MGTELLFFPGEIGQMRVKNRMIMSPMSTALAAADGGVTGELNDYYEGRVRGGLSSKNQEIGFGPNSLKRAAASIAKK
jgi:2,4-dienoyl-CoA reductase-like NADH-dependent reductase (Old Yellow Enzyme family)